MIADSDLQAGFVSDECTLKETEANSAVGQSPAQDSLDR